MDSTCGQIESAASLFPVERRAHHYLDEPMMYSALASGASVDARNWRGDVLMWFLSLLFTMSTAEARPPPQFPYCPWEGSPPLENLQSSVVKVMGYRYSLKHTRHMISFHHLLRQCDALSAWPAFLVWRQVKLGGDAKSTSALTEAIGATAETASRVDPLDPTAGALVAGAAIGGMARAGGAAASGAKSEKAFRIAFLGAFQTTSAPQWTEAARTDLDAFLEANPPQQVERRDRRRTIAAKSGDRVAQGAQGVASGVSKVGTGVSKIRSKNRFREVEGRDEYLYRQWPNGDIAIINGPLPDGWEYNEPGPRDRVWEAITNEIGPYP